VVVLTNVGLEHTRWLGPTIGDIAGEKLAVVREGATLVVGAGLHSDAQALAQASPACRLVVAPDNPSPAGLELLAKGRFQRRNFALATEAARAHLGALDAEAVRAAAASTLVPGRLEPIASDPEGAEVFFDGAHNAGGMAALAEALPELVGDRPLVACLAVLDDKDAAEMLRVLLPHCSGAVVTRTANPRALSPGTLQSLCRQLGFDAVEARNAPAAALARARELAGPRGVALATGSIYLIADLLRPAGAVSSTL
jgi:dihydrofolate synthase/folylpolyglutamate synthase